MDQGDEANIMGEARIGDLVPMPGFYLGGGFGGRGYPFALCGSGGMK